MELERMKQECENNRLHYTTQQDVLRQSNEAVEATAKLAANSMFLVSGGSVVALLSYIAQKGAMPVITTALTCCVASTLVSVLALGVMYIERYTTHFFLQKEIYEEQERGKLSCWVYYTLVVTLLLLWFCSFGLLCYAAYTVLTDPFVFDRLLWV